MICVPPFTRRSLAGCLSVVLLLTGCAGPTENAPPGRVSYVVFFSGTRTADHSALASASVPVTLGGEGSVKISSHIPVENQPALSAFLARLHRTRQSGVYELVTRVTVREAIRNKKGKLKINQRFLGALVPTRLGEHQVVSAEADPIHLEARLERH